MAPIRPEEYQAYKELENRDLLETWMHRSRGMSCATCMWFVEKGKLGRCRKHAPTMSGYPVVYTTDWCGDHKLDETKV